MTVQSAAEVLQHRQAYDTGAAPYLEVYAEVVRTGKTAVFDSFFAPLDKHFEISVCPPHKRRFATIFTDITRRKQAEAALRRLAAIVEFSEDAIIAEDLEGVVVSWNQAAERIFGYSAAEMLGKANSMVVPEDRLAELEQIQSRIASGERIADFETVRIRKGGQRFPVSLTVSPVKDISGQVIGASAIRN